MVHGVIQSEAKPVGGVDRAFFETWITGLGIVLTMPLRFLFFLLLLGCLFVFTQFHSNPGVGTGKGMNNAPCGLVEEREGPEVESHSDTRQGVQEPSKPIRESAGMEEPIIEEEPDDPGVDDEFEESFFRVDGDNGYWKPDPIEKGNCSLRLTLIDSLSGRPVSGDVDLWRLCVPGNEWWTEGDQQQGRLSAKQGTVLVNDLPAGFYRAYVHRARSGSESAPRFMVEGELTSVQILVESPRPECMRLHLVDSDGFPVQTPVDSKFAIRKRSSIRHHPGNLQPEWLSHRDRTDPSLKPPERQAGGASLGSSAESWTEVEYASGEIDLGEVRGDPRDYSSFHHWDLRLGAGRPARVGMTPTEEGNYVAIWPDVEEILECVELPEGIAIEDLRNAIDVTIRAVSMNLNEGETVATQWPQAKATANIRLRGFETARFQWKPSMGAKPRIQLKRK